MDDANELCQGELCFRGRNIMMGYMACPDLGPEHAADINKKNAEALGRRRAADGHESGSWARRLMSDAPCIGAQSRLRAGGRREA